MKHYLSREDFKKRLLNMQEGEIIRLYTETIWERAHGDYNIVAFKMLFFAGAKIFLHSYPETLEIGLIQKDDTYGWDTINYVFDDFQNSGYTLFVNE